MRPILLVLVVVLPVVLAGCADDALPGAGVSADPPVVPVPVHVVLVGPHPDLDRATLLEGLPNGSRASLTVQSETTGVRELVPYRTAASWSLHEAPAAFADGLFAAIAANAEDAPPTGFLVAYDESSGERRLCSVCDPRLPEPAPRPVKRVDALAVEAWIAANRAAHGLAFEPHASTVFLLDHYTEQKLDASTYWQYRFDDGTGLTVTQTMRAWGGTHDFVWFDRSAAPDSFDWTPWFVFGEDDTDKLNGRTDPPLWDTAGDSATATANLRFHLRDFYHLRAAREPLYAPHAVDRIHVKAYFVVDEAATLNPTNPAARFLAKGGADLFDADHIKASFETLAPWVEWSVELVTLNLPEDDPALAAALRQAKVEGGGAIHLRVLQSYFRGTFEDYAPPLENGRTYPLAFIISDAPSSSHPLAFQGGVALGNPRGASMVSYASFGDASACPTRLDRVVCFFEDRSEDAAAFYTNYVTHEVGHNLAMRHPHDREGEEDYTAYRANALWDSTLTAMTYRHWGPGFDAFDRRYYATHTAAMRLAAAPDDPDAPEVRSLLESGRLEEAGAVAKAKLPVARDPHDRFVVPETPMESVTGDVRVVNGAGDAFGFTAPEGATWARVRIDGTSDPLTYSAIVGPDGREFSFSDASHRDTHLFSLVGGESYAVRVGGLREGTGSAAVTVTVDFFDTEPVEPEEH